MKSVYVFDPTTSDEKSKVRGVGRYLQILKENFPQWKFGNLSEADSDVFINPFFNFLQPPLPLRKVAGKQIAVIHDLIPLQFPDHFPIGIRGMINVFLNKLAIRNYDLIVTDSETSKKTIQQILGIDPKKIKVIYPCLPKLFTTKEPGTKPVTHDTLPSKFCLYVGDATWNKNLENLAKAIKEINVTCIFVGKIFSSKSNDHPWQKELREFMEGTKNDKRFVFPGYVSDDELKTLYARSALNLLVSREEGFGFSYLEAGSQLCPSVLSDIPVFRETSNGRGAIFANPDNVQDIANDIGGIFFHKDIKNKLGEEAYQRSLFFHSGGFKKSWFTAIEDIQ